MSELPFLPYGRQSIDQDDIDAVTRVLQSDFLTTGPEIAAFEQELCEYTGAKYAVAVANGTAALHLAVLALELPTGSIGITSPNTFVATSNALIYAGHTPHFVDIDPKSYVMDPDILAEVMKDVETMVVLPVHFAGHTAGVEDVSRIARSHEAFVIEDAAHSIGGRYLDGTRVGSCSHSDMTTFSFHPVKTMTTGEGGAITTNDPELYRRLMTLRTHGITRDPAQLTQQPGPWYYEMQMLGFNYRMTDFQAALGRSQFKKLDGFVKRRRELVARYNEAFADIPWITIPWEEPDRETAWHLYVLQLDWDVIGMDRPTVMARLREQGIGTQVLYIPVPDQPYYKEQYRYPDSAFSNAKSYYENALAIPLYPAMKDGDQERVVEAIRGLL
jgi:UDP-4-amino-4,6-dideoxy-N-acetyl-beta-L-altrosamine transaminase